VTTKSRSYAIDPRQLIKVLADNIPPEIFSTGLLPDDVIQVVKNGDCTTTISYREPKATGIWLEGVSEALKIPMPGMILARQHNKGHNNNSYHLVAITEEPKPETKLFMAPLPNTSPQGVCWGTVQKTRVEDDGNHSMREDWRSLLGSPFGNHTVGGKSRSKPKDIREMLIQLDKRHARKYPSKDLIPLQRQPNYGEKANERQITYEEWVSMLIGKGKH
jgi:hypothetical protein